MSHNVAAKVRELPSSLAMLHSAMRWSVNIGVLIRCVVNSMHHTRLVWRSLHTGFEAEHLAG